MSVVYENIHVKMGGKQILKRRRSLALRQLLVHGLVPWKLLG